MSDSCFSVDDFSGQVRLFPVPNLVMFPQVIQPLHVFEQRYRDLLDEALETDKLIAMPVLGPGWEANYEGRPDLEPIACLGKVVSSQLLPDGCSNIMLLGLARIGLTKELSPRKTFREATADLLSDEIPSQGTQRRVELHSRLASAFKQKLRCNDQDPDWLDEMLRQEVSLGALTDIVAHTLDLPVAFKQQLLADRNVDRRACALLESLDVAQRSGDKAASWPWSFPPRFSEN